MFAEQAAAKIFNSAFNRVQEAIVLYCLVGFL